MDLQFLVSLASIVAAVAAVGAAVAAAIEAKSARHSARLATEQLKQIQSEQRHRKWEALQWLLEVATDQELQVLSSAIKDLSTREFEDAEFTYTSEAEELRAAIRAGQRKLEIISAAIKDGFADKHLYFQLRGRELLNLAGSISEAIDLYREMYGTRHTVRWINNLSDKQTPIDWLFTEVAEWSEKYRPFDRAKLFTHNQ